MPLKGMKENTKASRLLMNMFMKGEIGDNEKPAEVKQRVEIFQEYDTRSFGQKFRKYKELYKEYAHCRRTGLEARNTEDSIELQFGSIEAGIVSADSTDERLKFQPHYFFSEWLDRHAGMATRLTVIVLLPSGITGTDVDVNISDEGSKLELKFIWPVPFIRPQRLCAAFIADPEAQSYNENHPEVIALEKELKSIRTANGLSHSKPIASKTRIPLRFEVQTGRTEKYAFNHFDRQARSNGHVMHIRLFAKETEYDDTASVGANQVITIEA